MNVSISKQIPRLCAILSLGLVASFPVYAHHILGVPHYNYDEAYPQTPILTMKTEVHGFSIEITGNPGNPQPGDRCNLHVYIRDLETGKPYDGTVTLSVERERMLIRNERMYGPIDGKIEEAMYKFHPEFDLVGNYAVLASFHARGEEWIIEMPIVVGEPTSPWRAAAPYLGGITLLLVVARAMRIKQKRRATISKPEAELANSTDGKEQYAK